MRCGWTTDANVKLSHFYGAEPAQDTLLSRKILRLTAINYCIAALYCIAQFYAQAKISMAP
jgi:hypothetical protein